VLAVLVANANRHLEGGIVMPRSSRLIAVKGDSQTDGSPATGTVLFEVSDQDFTGEVAGWGDVAATGDVAAEEAGASLARAVDAVKPLTARIVDEFRSLGEAAPKEIEINLGIKLSAKVGFFVAESQGEASIGVKLKWTAA